MGDVKISDFFLSSHPFFLHERTACEKREVKWAYLWGRSDRWDFCWKICIARFPILVERIDSGEPKVRIKCLSYSALSFTRYVYSNKRNFQSMHRSEEPKVFYQAHFLQCQKFWKRFSESRLWRKTTYREMDEREMQHKYAKYLRVITNTINNKLWNDSRDQYNQRLINVTRLSSAKVISKVINVYFIYFNFRSKKSASAIISSCCEGLLVSIYLGN